MEINKQGGNRWRKDNTNTLRQNVCLLCLSNFEKGFSSAWTNISYQQQWTVAVAYRLVNQQICKTPKSSSNLHLKKILVRLIIMPKGSELILIQSYKI